MREGWEYKKLGDFISEYSVKNRCNETIPVYSVTNSQGFCKDYFSKEVASQDKRTYKIVPYGCFAYNPSRINVGSVDWQNKEDRVIVSPLYNVFSVSENLNQDFLLYFLKSNGTMGIINTLATGTVRLNLKLSMLKEFPIIVPPLSVQQSIVEELNAINELIRLKKEQLKDYDNLAQSIFYEMFGDPVVNEKGWEVDYLSHLCNVFAGGDKPSDLSEMQSKDFPYPVIANGDGDKGILGYSKMCKIKEDAVTIGARGASIGNCRLVRNGFTPAIRLITLVPQMKLDCNYLYYYVRNMNYRVNGVAQAQLTVPNVQRELIPIPPLPLQQLFAQRIELIEKQKAEVQRTIADLETLLASRMQYWFD